MTTRKSYVFFFFINIKKLNYVQSMNLVNIYFIDVKDITT